ncbi:hypothetical protein B0T14DRAFT_570217 [Immersiella caudata]|uniref:F-box domain-containing protein n=1 Tax=Immersiella caudata TaxID=314043 RepID=A0AA39WF81_9PEZI|nr:hypothetical protein B0T14DRAFT_570217 [Immersiella caudata]
MANNIAHDPAEVQMRSQLNEARAHINSERYSKAVASIQRAVVACGCGSNDLHLSKRACNLAQGVRAVIRSDNEAFETTARSPCSCGYVWPSCSRSLHAEAIDELAKCLEQAGRLTAAFSVALGLIRMNPAWPIGYCRAVRISRRLWSNSPDLPAVVVRERAAVIKDVAPPSGQTLSDLTKPLIRKGLYCVGKNPDRRRSQYDIILNKMAVSLKMVEAQRDPVKELPRETLTQIFSHLESGTLCTCIMVSKLWAHVLGRDGVLWNAVTLGHPGNPGPHIASFLNKHIRDIKTFSIFEIKDFSLTAGKLKVMLALPHLQRLRLGTANPPHPSSYAQGTLKDLRGRTKLTHLHVAGINWTLVKELADCNRQTLQVLDITDQSLPQWSDFNSLGPLPRVRKLRLVGSRTSGGCVTMDRIMATCPGLEDIYIDGVELEPLRATPSHPGWNGLRSIILGQHTRLTPRLFVPFLAKCTKLESIEILIPRLTAYCASLFAVGTTDGSDSVFEAGFNYDDLDFPHLKVFRCRSALDHMLLQSILKSSVENGKLEVLELSMGHSVYSPSVVANPNVRGLVVPDRDYPFTFSDSMRTLGLYDFNWTPAVNTATFDGGPFIDWLRHFPNVDDLRVYPGQIASDAMLPLIRDLLDFDKVKVIYQDRLTRGTDWDSAKRAAKAKGVLLHNLRDFVAPKWVSFD